MEMELEWNKKMVAVSDGQVRVGVIQAYGASVYLSYDNGATLLSIGWSIRRSVEGVHCEVRHGVRIIK